MKAARKTRKQPSQGNQGTDDVVLRRWRQGGGVIALFPDVLETDGLVMSYQHVGQHGAADYQHVINKSVPVSLDEPDPERDALLAELQSIGYSHLIRRRRKGSQR